MTMNECVGTVIWMQNYKLNFEFRTSKKQRENYLYVVR